MLVEYVDIAGTTFALKGNKQAIISKTDADMRGTVMQNVQGKKGKLFIIIIIVIMNEDSVTVKNIKVSIKGKRTKQLELWIQVYI